MKCKEIILTSILAVAAVAVIWGTAASKSANSEIAPVQAASVSASPAMATPDADNIVFTNSITKITAGKCYTFKAESSNSSSTIKWSVSKVKYASINANGKFTAKRVGKVDVVAAADSATKRITVTINPKKTVAIDAGHQEKGDSSTEPVGPGAKIKKAKVAGGTSGSSTGVPEYKLTLVVAKKLKNELIARGYKVVMIRSKNEVNISNSERAKKANNTSDICIRLHADGSASSSVSGASALYPSTSNKYCGRISKSSKKLSSAVINKMCENAGTKNRGICVRDDLTGTNWSTIPVTLIEMGFMTNPTEDRNMQNPKYQNKLAAGMVEGIEKYFGY